MTPAQNLAHRLARDPDHQHGARYRLAVARARLAERADDLAADLADTIDSRRTIDTDDYEDAPAGWTLAASIDYAAAELDPEGEYHQDPRPGAIKRRHRGDHREYLYWTPNYSVAQYRADLSQQGWPRHAAWIEANRRVERDEQRDRTAVQVPVTVTASRNRIELGSATVWTSTSEEDNYTDARTHLAALLADLWPEAVENASAALAELVATA